MRSPASPAPLTLTRASRAGRGDPSLIVTTPEIDPVPTRFGRTRVASLRPALGLDSSDRASLTNRPARRVPASAGSSPAPSVPRSAGSSDPGRSSRPIAGGFASDTVKSSVRLSPGLSVKRCAVRDSTSRNAGIHPVRAELVANRDGEVVAGDERSETERPALHARARHPHPRRVDAEVLPGRAVSREEHDARADRRRLGCRAPCRRRSKSSR